MSKKVKTILSKDSKYYLGSGLPNDTDLELSNFDLKYLEVNLTTIEYNLCKNIIKDFCKVFNNTGYRTGDFYQITKRLYLDLGLTNAKHKEKDNRYKIYLHFKE